MEVIALATLALFITTNETRYVELPGVVLITLAYGWVLKKRSMLVPGIMLGLACCFRQTVVVHVAAMAAIVGWQGGGVWHVVSRMAKHVVAA